MTGSRDQRPADAALFILMKSRGSELMPGFDVSGDIESLDAFDSAAGKAEWKDSRYKKSWWAQEAVQIGQ